LANDAEITVRIVGLEEGRALNLNYRKKDYATNVLTFDYAQSPVVMADLVLCAPVVAQEARNKAKHWQHIMYTCWCMARCMRKAGITKPVRPMLRPWKHMKLRSCTG
jgi:hypothetical protein